MKNIFPDVDKSKLDDFYKNIGINVKRIRQEHNLSQLELALMIGQKKALHIIQTVKTIKIKNILI